MAALLEEMGGRSRPAPLHGFRFADPGLRLSLWA
jgi:hypothetical protein